MSSLTNVVLNVDENATVDPGARPSSAGEKSLPSPPSGGGIPAQRSGKDIALLDEFITRHNLSPSAKADLAQMVKTITRQQVIKVRVPATTANMGPGFDCCGMALDVWNDVIVERAPEFSMVIEGEGASEIPKDETNLVCKGVRAAYKFMKKAVPDLRYVCKNRIPFCKGMGSSSAAVVSGIIAGLALEDHQLHTSNAEELLQIACGIEGHPDNVAPCIYGGMQLGYKHNDLWWTSRVRIPHGLVCVIFAPDHITETSMARGILHDAVPRQDAIFNMSRLALLINALSTENYDALRTATEDALHQRQRAEKVHFHLFPIIDASLAAGAKACFLSGAGPAVCALCVGRRGDVFTQTSHERTEQAVARAMLKAADTLTNCPGKVLITAPVDFGGHVVAEESNLGSKSALTEESRIAYLMTN